MSTDGALTDGEGPGGCRCGSSCLSRPSASGRRSPPRRGRHTADQTQRRPDPRRRPRLRRSRRLRPEGHPHAAPRPAGRRGAALHRLLRRLDGLRPFARGAHDRTPHRPRQRAGQRAATRTADPGAAGGRAHRGPPLQGRGLRDRPLRQVGPRRGGLARAPEPHGLRRLLRLPQPAPRPQLLPVVPVARLGARAAAQPARAARAGRLGVRPRAGGLRRRP